jgi:NADH-quinone oxidoreductase subunit N
MTVLAQAIPEIPWAALSPELVLFGVGILVLLLETAGDQRVQASAAVAAIMTAGALLAVAQLDQLVLPGLVILGAVTQFGLTLMWQRRPRVLSALLTAIGLLATIGTVAWQWAAYSEGGAVQAQSLLADMVALDGVALFTRVIVCLAALVSIPLGWAYLQDRRVHRAEYYPLILFAAVGMNLLASAADLIMVFIAIEVLSLALYVLSGFATRDLTSQESAFKYFLLGSFSSAILLYGIALTYGVTGSTNIAEAGQAMTLAGADALPLLAMGLLLVGFAFKTAVVPFHMWTPDVYQGAPTPVTGFMAAGTKAAAFAAFLRVFTGAFAPLEWSWVPVIWTLAIITMLAGAILAVVQTDVKRMLGYSAIAHAGYVLIGLISVNASGVGATMFYLLVYALMSVGAFGVLSLIERRQQRAVRIEDLRGLWRRNPVPTVMLGLFLFSLAGLPGTAGFMAKLAVFRAGLEAGQVALVVVAVISSVIAAFFYLRVTVAMIIEDEPADLADEPPAALTIGMQTGLAITGAAVVLLGVLPGIVVDLSASAASLVR